MMENMAIPMATEVENTAPPSTPPPASSVPSSDAPAIDQSSPASSPPAFPWDDRETIATKRSYHASESERNVFSVLGKRKLTPLNGNIITTTAKKIKRADDGKTQMQLHLGQKIQKKCKDCGMQYISSSSEDRELHAKFHKQHIEGVDVGATFVESSPTGLGRRIYDGVGGRTGDKIVVVDCFDKKPRRRKGHEVLEIVQRDLGAVEIVEAAIWDAPKEVNGEPKFRSLMYVREGKCVGFLLVERISEAFEVLLPKLPPSEAARDKSIPDRTPPKGKTSALAALQARKLVAEQERIQKEAALQAAAKQPLVLSQSRSPASLGICRIWTLPAHRGEGIAVALLDAAVEWRNDQIRFQEEESRKLKQRRRSEISDDKAPVQKTAALEDRPHAVKRASKEDGAFSQPTAAGTKLARKWMGKMSGWKVYID